LLKFYEFCSILFNILNLTNSAVNTFEVQVTSWKSQSSYRY